MSMKLKNVVPFGRSLDEYRKIFSLTADDLQKNILSVADGPASFNAELSKEGGRVTSIDPVYAFDADEIKLRFEAVIDNIIAQVENTPDNWVWSYHDSPEGLRRNRQEVTRKFIEDYQQNSNKSRYITGELPKLPFADEKFDLALCSHFLFLYSAHFSYDFHLESVYEILRVADEVRIFPLLTLARETSAYIAPLRKQLEADGIKTKIQEVEYELQKGGNKMLVIQRG
ncbi:MAG: SAM-dependent methyltransferase [Lentisphaeraceae bacterium]|nr:SAM-dependent methyltransferase [Lentisphaeraceae bacterium]